MTYETILYEADGPVLTVTLNRPDKLNAYTGVMGAELEDAFLRADADDAIRAIIVTGAGRGFCAGADISSGAGAFDTAAEGSVAFATGNQPRRSGGGFVGAIFNCRKPSIAAINGAAVGVGITLTLPMDVRIAARGFFTSAYRLWRLEIRLYANQPSKGLKICGLAETPSFCNPMPSE